MAPAALISNPAHGNLTKQRIAKKDTTTANPEIRSETSLQAICYGSTLPSNSSSQQRSSSHTPAPPLLLSLSPVQQSSHLLITLLCRYPFTSDLRRSPRMGSFAHDSPLSALGPPRLQRGAERAHFAARSRIPVAVLDEPAGGALRPAARLRYAPAV